MQWEINFIGTGNRNVGPICKYENPYIFCFFTFWLRFRLNLVTNDVQASTESHLFVSFLNRNSALKDVDIYNFDIVTAQLQKSRVFPSASLSLADAAIIMNSKDNCIRICTLQKGSLRILVTISGLESSSFMIRYDAIFNFHTSVFN